MSLYVNPKQSVINAINAANSLSLTVTDVVFAGPTVAPTDVVTTTGKNTQVRVTGNGTTWTGTVVVNYTRLQLSDLLVLTSDTLRVGPITTMHEVVNYLNFYYGMVLTADDIVDGAVSLDNAGAGTVTLTAKPGSYGWLGSITLNLVKGDDLVDYAVTDTSLNGIQYPTGQTSRAQGPLALYAYDFTQHYADFSTRYPANLTFDSAAAGTPGVDLTVKLNAMTNPVSFTWHIGLTANAPLNLANAKVIYNGLNQPEFSTNPNYKYVMMIQLPDGSGNNGVTSARHTRYYGVLYLHYNDPVS